LEQSFCMNNMFRIILAVQLCWLATSSVYGLDCDPEENHYYVMSSCISGGYTLDLYVPAMLSGAELPIDTSNLEWFVRRQTLVDRFLPELREKPVHQVG